MKVRQVGKDKSPQRVQNQILHDINSLLVESSYYFHVLKGLIIEQFLFQLNEHTRAQVLSLWKDFRLQSSEFQIVIFERFTSYKKNKTYGL